MSEVNELIPLAEEAVWLLPQVFLWFFEATENSLKLSCSENDIILEQAKPTSPIHGSHRCVWNSKASIDI